MLVNAIVAHISFFAFYVSCIISVYVISAVLTSCVVFVEATLTDTYFSSLDIIAFLSVPFMTAITPIYAISTVILSVYVDGIVVVYTASTVSAFPFVCRVVATVDAFIFAVFMSTLNAYRVSANSEVVFIFAFLYTGKSAVTEVVIVRIMSAFCDDIFTCRATSLRQAP
jgi:hypothetical protein